MRTYPSILFYVASVSLISAGSLFNPDLNIYKLLLLLWCNIGGTYIVYKLPSLVRQNGNFDFEILPGKVSRGTKLFLLQFLVLTLPASLYFFSWQQVLMLGLVCIMGFAYAYEVKIREKVFMLKKVFMIKNFLIGIGWGGLILIGYGGWDSPTVNSLFVFTSLQVFVGSVIRDLQDYDRDRRNGVNTLPVILGRRYTFMVSHILNILSFILAVFVATDAGLSILYLIVIVWKTVNLLEVSFKTKSVLWGQKLNLATCFIIFLVLIIEYRYAFI